MHFYDFAVGKISSAPCHMPIFLDISFQLSLALWVQICKTKLSPCLKHIQRTYGLFGQPLVYCYALSADLRSRLRGENSSQLWSLVAIVLGSIPAISLVFKFVQRSNIDHIILYTTWIVTTIIVVVYQYGMLLLEACHQLYNKTLKPFFIDICDRFQANKNSSTGQQRPILQVQKELILFKLNVSPYTVASNHHMYTQ